MARALIIGLGLLGGLGGILIYSKAKAETKKKAVRDSLDLGLDDPSLDCALTSDLQKFADDNGYVLFYFTKEQAEKRAKELGLAHWTLAPPKQEFAANAKAYSEDGCTFVLWNGSKWTADKTTNAEFEQWKKGPPAPIPEPQTATTPKTKPAGWPDNYPWPPVAPSWWPTGVDFPPYTSEPLPLPSFGSKPPEGWPWHLAWPPLPNQDWWPLNMPFPLPL